MTTDQAETLALQVLVWISADDELSGGFLGMTGAAPEDLRLRAKDPDFLGFVLDYLLSSDDMVLTFADAHSLPPESLMQARAKLPGGDIPNWT